MKRFTIIDDLQEPDPIYSIDFLEALFNTEIYYTDDNGVIDDIMDADKHLKWFFEAFEISEKKPKDERTFYLYNEPFYWVSKEDIKNYENKSIKCKVVNLFSDSKNGKSNKKS